MAGYYYVLGPVKGKRGEMKEREWVGELILSVSHMPGIL